MFIHFVFGHLSKEGKLYEQTKEFINKVLEQRRIRISICKEFIPIPNISSEKAIHLDITKGKIKNGAFSLSLGNTVSAPSIGYLPEDVPMVCFINIPFKKLATCSHSREYGKLGIVFQQEFYYKNSLKKVIYYDERSILKDKLIKKFSEESETLKPEEKKNLIREITAFRKPKILTENFSKSVVASINVKANRSKLSFFTYDRYPLGYDFTQESEHRMVFEKGKEFLSFEEKDVYMILAPTEKMKLKIENYLIGSWEKTPKVVVFPK